MVYVMSDIHGQYEKYSKMLEKIALTDEDELYILGDVVDRGDGSIRILQDMSMRANVFPILGNHDYMAERILRKLNITITEENCDSHLSATDIKMLSAWLLDGGNPTLTAYKELPAEEREYILDYLSEFTPYEALRVGKNRFLLVHGGLPDFDPARPIEDYDLGGLLTDRPDYSKRYFSNTYLVTGHTPTCTIGEEYDSRIYRANGHIAIDCGAGWDKPLGCIRLDDFQEFYVE